MAQDNRWNPQLEQERQEDTSHTTILTADEARQGVVSGRISLLLAVSLTLVVVAFAIIYAVHV